MKQCGLQIIDTEKIIFDGEDPPIVVLMFVSKRGNSEVPDSTRMGFRGLSLLLSVVISRDSRGSAMNVGGGHKPPSRVVALLTP
jgi:hypothetical protein